MRKQEVSDYILNDDGTATFEFDDFTRTLKRPTLGQYRGCIESLGSLRDEVLREITADGSSQRRTATVQVELVVEWYDNVFQKLAGEGLPRIETTLEDGSTQQVIDEDRLPAWLISADIVAELIEHWQTTPSRRAAR